MRAFWRGWIAAALALLVAVGCSMVSIGYGHAPALLAWRADQWLDLDGEQAALLRARLDEAHAWHRQRLLPALLERLDEARARLGRPLAVDDLAWFMDELRRHWASTAAGLAERAAPLAATLRPEQLAHLEATFARRNRDYARERLQGSAEEIAEARQARVLDTAEDWLGKLSPEQRRWLRERVAALPPEDAEVLAERERRQRELLAVLRRSREGAPVQTTAAGLARWASDWDAGRTPEQRAQRQDWRRAWSEITLDLINGASAEQRAHLRERLARTVRELSPYVRPAPLPVSEPLPAQR